MFINEHELERIVSEERNYASSKRILTYGDVFRYIEVVFNVPSQTYYVHAMIDSNHYKNRVTLSVDLNGHIVRYDCDCYFCSSKSGCGHVGALILKLQELNPRTFPFYYKDETFRNYEQYLEKQQKEAERFEIREKEKQTKALIEKYKTMSSIEMKSHILPKQYMLEPTLTYSAYFNELDVSYRIGNDKMYVVKDLRKLVDNIKNEATVAYGKNLTILHQKDAFDSSAQSQISFLERSFVHAALHYDGYYSNMKLLKLNEHILDDFYDTYNQLPHYKNQFSLKISNERMNIQVEEDEDNFVVSFYRDKKIMFGDVHAYYVEEERNLILNRIEFDRTQKTMDLLKQLMHEDTLLVSKEDMQAFCKYVLYDIHKYIDILGIDLKEFIQPESKIELYGDVDEEGRMYIRLECYYDEHTMSEGFDPTHTTTSVNFEKVESFVKDYADSIDEQLHVAYLNDHSEKTYEFISEGLPYLSEYCDIFVSDSLKRVGTTSNFNIQVGVGIQNDLLVIDVNSVDIPKDELVNVLGAYNKRKRFYKLKNGKLLHLESDDLEELSSMMDNYHIAPKQFEDGTIRMDPYRMFSVDDFAENTSHIQVHRDASFKSVVDNFTKVSKSSFQVPTQYKDILRDYQRDGFAWLHTMNTYHFGGILADDMGLGKTLQMIAMLESIKDEGKLNTSIVVCPSSLIFNWEDEIHKFSNELTCLCIHGSLSERMNQIKEIGKYDIIITSYDYMRRDFDLYKDTTFDFIIIDEAQYIKNPKTKNAISIKRLNGKQRFALTGTPIENSLSELWSIFDFLMPGYLYNYSYFRKRYEQPIVKEENEDVQKELKSLIEPFILRRNKSDVLTELPDKEEHTIMLEFSEDEKKLYYANLSQVNEDLREHLKMDKFNKIEVLAMLTRLRQICCEPRICLDGITNVSSKMLGCLEIIQTLNDSNKQVLLFSSFTSVLDLLAEELTKRHISFYKLTGQTDKKERRRLVSQFQEDNTSVFLISLKAGGTGLNLTAAQAVIHFDPWWNQSAQNQATDRAYRIGQRNNVQVFKLIMKDSVEEKIMAMQKRKQNLSDTFVEDNEGSITTMSSEALMDLFKI